jgi:hydrogenase-4 component F
MILTLLLILPLTAAAAAFFARERSGMEAVNLTAFGLILILAIALAGQVLSDGPVSLLDGFLYADALSALTVLLTAFIALLCSAYAVGYLREDERIGSLDEEDDPGAALSKQRKYYTLTPLFVFSMLLVALANNLGVMWAAVELTTLASVFLVTFYGKATSLEAAWKYAMIGGVGLSMALFGTIVTYYAAHRLPGSEGLSGLNWTVLAQQAAALDKTTMRLAFILVLLGYGTKAGLAPMHTWKPDAYSEAPVPAAAILSSAMLNCAMYALVRFYILTSRSVGAEFPGHLLILLGVFSMAVAVPFVLVQKNFRRLLAYSTIDQAGIMATALGIGGKAAALGLMLHMTFHTVAKPLLFLSAGNMYQHFRTDLFQKLKGGVMRVMPLTGPVFFMAMLAIVGMPPFSLFQSEFLIVTAAFGSGYRVPGLLFILCGVGVFAGILSHTSRLILGPAEEPTAAWYPWRDTSLIVLAAILAGMIFWLPAPLLELIHRAAAVVSGE